MKGGGTERRRYPRFKPEPGTVILFSCLTPHTSAPNRSARPRRALILTYNPAQDGSGYEPTSGANREQSNAWLAAQRENATQRSDG